MGTGPSPPCWDSWPVPMGSPPFPPGCPGLLCGGPCSRRGTWGRGGLSPSQSSRGSQQVTGAQIPEGRPPLGAGEAWPQGSRGSQPASPDAGSHPPLHCTPMHWTVTHPPTACSGLSPAQSWSPSLWDHSSRGDRAVTVPVSEWQSGHSPTRVGSSASPGGS